MVKGVTDIVPDVTDNPDPTITPPNVDVVAVGSM